MVLSPGISCDPPEDARAVLRPVVVREKIAYGKSGNRRVGRFFSASRGNRDGGSEFAAKNGWAGLGRRNDLVRYSYPRSAWVRTGWPLRGPLTELTLRQ